MLKNKQYILIKSAQFVALLGLITSSFVLQSCNEEFYLPAKADTSASAQLRIFSLGGDFGGEFKTVDGADVGEVKDENSYLYINNQLNNIFNASEAPLRIVPPLEKNTNEKDLQFGKYVLPSVTNKGDRYLNALVYVDLANNSPYTYGNSKRGAYFPGFYYSKPKGGILGTNDFSRWANVNAGTVEVKINPLGVTDLTNSNGNLFYVPSQKITTTTLNLEAGKIYTGVWGIQKRSTDELSAQNEKPERKLVLIQEPTAMAFSEDNAYVRFVNMTENDLTARYKTNNPNTQFPALNFFTLFKATTPHPVQAVDVYVRETYEEINPLGGNQPWTDSGFNPTLATANLKPFDASNTTFTPVFSLKKVVENGGKIPRLEVFMYPTGTDPSSGIPPVVYISNLKVLIQGKKLSTSIATLVFSIDNKKFDFSEQYQYRGFVYNLIPKNAYKEFFE